jgi:hypothetical protein
MSRIAVDIVLLPDETMSERAIEVNSQLVREYDSQIMLSKDDSLPHISLAMGCIESGQVVSIGNAMREATVNYPHGELIVTGIVTTLNAKGRQISSFALAKTAELQSLHEDITHRMQEYFSSDATAAMIYGGQPVAESTLTWIRTFREKSSFGAFFPHITIGYGPVNQPMTFPMRMEASRLALCHLGNHCTCRRILTCVDL